MPFGSPRLPLRLLGIPKGGVPMDNVDYHNDKSPFHKYCVSKPGNYLQATEVAKKFRADNVVSALNPCNLNSELYRDPRSHSAHDSHTFCPASVYFWSVHPSYLPDCHPRLRLRDLVIGVGFNLQFSRTKMNVGLCKAVPWDGS